MSNHKNNNEWFFADLKNDLYDLAEEQRLKDIESTEIVKEINPVEEFEFLEST